MCTSIGLTSPAHFLVTTGVDALLNPQVTVTFYSLDRMEVRSAIYRLNVS
jgi:hypothetical protein